MSDSESDGFRIADDSGSDDFVAPSKAVKKAAPVKKVAASSSKTTKVCVSTFGEVRADNIGSCCKESSSQETTSSSKEECPE
jgi:hypothetical protein